MECTCDMYTIKENKIKKQNLKIETNLLCSTSENFY